MSNRIPPSRPRRLVRSLLARLPGVPATRSRRRELDLAVERERRLAEDARHPVWLSQAQGIAERAWKRVRRIA
jgi:hypothetical protein